MLDSIRTILYDNQDAVILVCMIIIFYWFRYVKREIIKHIKELISAIEDERNSK